jgi:hypothetical protein
MDPKTRDLAVKMALKMKAQGRSFFEQILTLRAEFGLTLEQAKEVHLEADDGRRMSLSDRQGEFVPALDAAILEMEPV